jgi:alpha-ribazole phosphatase
MRHPRPAIAQGVCYGSTDVALAATVEAQAFAGLPKFDRLVSSPLTRCVTLATALADARGHVALIDDRLREMDFGSWEGQDWDMIPRAELDAWAADFFHARPHGGESVAMLSTRVASALSHYRSRSGETLIVTHAGVVKAALGDWTMALGFGAWVRID